MRRDNKCTRCRVVILTASLCFILAGFLFQLSAAEEQTAPNAAKLEQIRLIKELGKKEMNDTKWEIVIKRSGAEEDGYPMTDTLIFEGRKFRSEKQEERGYVPTNCSIRVEDDGTIIWETMQSKDGEDVVFWRGERSGDTLKGIISRKNEKGATIGYTFSSTRFERTKELEGVEGRLMAELENLRNMEAGTAAGGTKTGDGSVKGEVKKGALKNEQNEKAKKRWWPW